MILRLSKKTSRGKRNDIQVIMLQSSTSRRAYFSESRKTFFKPILFSAKLVFFSIQTLIFLVNLSKNWRMVQIRTKWRADLNFEFALQTRYLPLFLISLRNNSFFDSTKVETFMLSKKRRIL